MLNIFKYALNNDLLSINVIRTSVINANSVRFKKKTSKNVSESEDEDMERIDEFEEAIVDKSTKIVDVQVNSLRADLLIKAGLGVARNKVETLFYESKIRVNGERLLKKSAQIDVGDEIDVIRGASPNNPNFLTVARVEVLGAKEREGSVKVKLRRCKSLTVENYEEKWKPD